MPWPRDLPKPLILRDGRRVATLADARAVIGSLPRRLQQSERWLYVSALLLESAASRKAHINRTAVHLEHALKAEGLL